MAHLLLDMTFLHVQPNTDSSETQFNLLLGLVVQQPTSGCVGHK